MDISQAALVLFPVGVNPMTANPPTMLLVVFEVLALAVIRASVTSVPTLRNTMSRRYRYFTAIFQVLGCAC